MWLSSLRTDESRAKEMLSLINRRFSWMPSESCISNPAYRRAACLHRYRAPQQSLQPHAATQTLGLGLAWLSCSLSSSGSTSDAPSATLSLALPLSLSLSFFDTLFTSLPSSVPRPAVPLSSANSCGKPPAFVPAGSSSASAACLQS